MKFIWNNFTGGLALSSRIGAEGSYRYGVGVMIDNPPGYVYSGQGLTEDDDIDVLQEEAVMQDGCVLSVNQPELKLVKMGGGGGSVLVTDTSSDNHAVKGVASLTDTSTSPTTENYYGYDASGILYQDIGKYYYDGSEYTYEHRWWSNLTGDSNGLIIKSKCMFGKNQKLFVGGGAQLKIYDRLTNSIKTSIDFPDDIQGLNELGSYLVVTTKENIYIWDMNAVSWNYSIPIKGEFVDMTYWKGELYFVAKYPEGYYLNKINQNYSSFQTLRKIPTTIETGNNQVGLPTGNFTGVYSGSVKMTSSATGVWISVCTYSYDTSQYYTLFFRYGSRYGAMNDIFTIEHYDSGKGTQNAHLYTDYNLDSLYFLDSNNMTLYETPIEGRGGDKAYFETTEQMTPQVEQGLSKGIAKKLYVYPAADSSATTVKVRLDGTEYTLDNSATFTANEPKVFNLNGRKFTNAAVRLEKKIPKIYRLELEFDYKRQV